ncbi:PEPxxWA-CTERM sorting domain-containing protein [Novosphingobium sp. G106]|nr:PEPxxWA-CTERM sorting domain-containing protein [Novosphingobium sp. G106]
MTISGDHFDALVPLSALLPATGADPLHFRFNIWPRGGTPAELKQPISDFAPDNAVLASVPEASTWATMILGLGLVGAFLRARRVGAQFGQRTAHPA